jgi:hypothetical protein
MWWRWRKVRVASIPAGTRDLFEQDGELVISMVLAGGFTPAAGELNPLYTNPSLKLHARDWLTECRDTHARKEQRVELVEWAILVFVILGVITDVMLLLHERS